jgi:hypothetical protein
MYRIKVEKKDETHKRSLTVARLVKVKIELADRNIARF